MQRGGWQVVPSKFKSVADPTLQAAAAAAAEEIAVTLNKSVRLLKKNRELEGELYLEGTGKLAFRWTAVQTNEPSVLFYWAKLQYMLTLTDVSGGDATAPVVLVFKKKMNSVIVELVDASVAVVTAGGTLQNNKGRVTKIKH
jgi:hypothetical protein